MKNLKPLLVFDADKVLLDWIGGFLSFLKDTGHCVKHLEQYIGTTAFLTTEEMTKSDCKRYNREVLDKFVESGYLRKLDTFQVDAKEILMELKKEFDFAIVTCIGTDEESINQRHENIELRYGDIFLDVICIGFHESKEHSLRELAKTRNVVGFVDDRPKHLEEAISAGIKPILMSRGVDVCPVNAERYNVISCLSEIKNII